jgi:Ca2+-binding EF-hand superfamily protein
MPVSGGGVGQPGSGSNMPVSGGGVEDLHVGEKQVKHIVADRDIVRDLKDHFFPSFTDDAIVDVRITVAKEGSIIEKQLNDLKYEKILPSPTVSSPAAVKQFTTFNNGINLWVWRKKQGNFDGRLKPIIGMILSPLATSTILVCQGYLRLEESIGSQYLWIKRAADIYEENALAIIDLKVTSGKLKDKASALYMSPGQGFVQLEGNFTPDTIIGTILSNNAPDTFLWYLIRSEENAALHTASVHALVDAGHGERSAMLNAVKENAKKAVLAAAKQSRARKLMSFFSLSGSKSNFSMSAGSAKDLDANCISYGTLLNVTRLAVRNYVPWTLRFYSTVPTISFDFSELFHSFTNKMGEMSLSKFKKMLVSIGLYFSGREGNTLFYLFNRSANTSIKAVDFIAMLSFTGYEVDCICEAIKRRILLSVNYVESTSPTASVSSNYLTIAQKQLISSLFELVDSNNDGILAREDFRSLTTALGLHLSEYEINLVINYIFTLNNKNSEIMTIDVKDFLNFIEMESNLLYHRAHRVYHTQNKLRYST